MNIRIAYSELEVEAIRDCLKALGLDDNLYVEPGKDRVVSEDPVFGQVISRSHNGEEYSVYGEIHQDMVIALGVSSKRIAPFIVSLVNLAKSLKGVLRDEINTLQVLADTIREEANEE